MTIRGKRVVALAGAVAAVAMAMVPSTAEANTGCTTRTTQQAFARWGDTNQYFVAPGGGFEAGTPAWSMAGGAGTTWGNEPWGVAGGGSSSLRLPAGGTATSPQFCVASDEDSLRLVLASPGVAGSALHIHVRVVSGANVATNEMTVDGSARGWAVAPRMMLPDIRDASGQQYVTITLSTRNAAATWGVDAVMVDPWKTR